VVIVTIGSGNGLGTSDAVHTPGPAVAVPFAKQNLPSPLMDLGSVTSITSAKPCASAKVKAGKLNVKVGLFPSRPAIIAESGNAIRSAADTFDTGNTPLLLSFVRMPAEIFPGVALVRAVFAGTGSVMVSDWISVGIGEVIWNENARSQVPAAGSMMASEQKAEVRTSKPGLGVVVADDWTVGLASPYDERDRVGTEFADVDIVKTRIAAQAASRFNFFMFPPKTKDRTTPFLSGHVRYQFGTLMSSCEFC
jgi:hypothetical protein